MAVPATVFEIFTLKDRKLVNFPPHPSFRPRLGNPLEFGDEIWREKTRVLGLPDGEEIMMQAFFVLTQYRSVTEGQTDPLRSLLPALALHRAGKNLNNRARKLLTYTETKPNETKEMFCRLLCHPASQMDWVYFTALRTHTGNV